ncbi:MAG: efflux RND transporter periplasmic adaptor subunit [Planctomycetes bacterium]|nr:efflux RND transporter periplasmic adaptor subunit [Planctomycetota bacterium]
MKKLIVLLIVVLSLGGGLGFWYFKAKAGPGTTFRTTAVTLGTLKATIGATGTIEPEEVIDVGAQVAGRIENFGDDPSNPGKTVNYGSKVEVGTILAQLDPSLYRARRDAAKADLEKARADLLQQKAKVNQTQRDWERAQGLILSKSIAAAEFDLAKSAYEVAVANVGVSQAQISQAEAALKEAETNLDYTTIRAPVKGTIIDRRVNVGQTVVASLQAPSLFLLAKDLRKLEIWASVNEADIGQIKIGQPVTFTVDALPSRVFEGKVLRQGEFAARLNASMTQNVVTYTVVVSTENPDGILLPYLTANLQFEVAEKTDAILVPNAALRWLPKADQIAPDAKAAFMRGKRQKDSNANVKEKGKAEEKGVGEAAMVWIVDANGYVRPIRIRIGYSDGVNTEVLSGELREGMEVVTGEGRSNQLSGNANPFAPQMFGKKS